MQQTQNTLQDDLLQEMNTDLLLGNVYIHTEVDHDYINDIDEKFSFIGSKIDWSEVLHHFHRRVERLQYSVSVNEFFNRFVLAAGLGEKDKLIVVGDSALDAVLVFSVNTLRKYLVDVVSLPQHTYIISQDVCWCACFTMEGDMDFGLSLK